MRSHRFKSLVIWLFIVSTLVPFLSPFFATEARAQQLGDDYLDFTNGATPSWTAPPVLYASQWVSIDFIQWQDEISGEWKQFSTTGSTIVNPRTDFEDSYNGPKVNFIKSGITKVKEEYVGSIPTDDGRVIILKDFTLAVDVAAYTEEDYLSYFDYTPLLVEYTEELYRLESQDVKWDPDKDGPGKGNVLNPDRPNSLPYHQIHNGTITFHGYDFTENYFNKVAGHELEGTLNIQVTVNAENWQDVFKDLMTDVGNYTYGNEVWSRVLNVKSVQTDYGLVKDGRFASNFLHEKIISQDEGDASQSDADTIGNPPPEGSQGTGLKSFDPDEDATTETVDTGSKQTKTYSASGEYLADQSGFFQERYSAWLAQGPAEGQAPRMWLASGAEVVYSGNLGYDPDVASQKQVFFGARFRLKPEIGFDYYKHYWRYQKTIAEAYYYKYGWAGVAKDWRLGAGSSPTTGEVKSKLVVNSWYLKNAYVLTTFFITVQVGAFYDWEPSEGMEDYAGFGIGDLGQGIGDNAFPKGLVEGTEQGGAVGEYVRRGFRWALNPATASTPLLLAGLVVLAMWLYWGWQAYSKSHPKPPRQAQADAVPFMMFQQQQVSGQRSFFSYFLEGLGKKILKTIVLFIVMLIVFSLVL